MFDSSKLIIRSKSCTTQEVNTNLAASVFLRPTVTKEIAMLGVSDVMLLMTNFGADSAATHTVVHFACVAVVPMLIHEILLGDCECTHFVTNIITVLGKKRKVIIED